MTPVKGQGIDKIRAIAVLRDAYFSSTSRVELPTTQVDPPISPTVVQPTVIRST
jgi:hypothetical protein